MSKKSSPKSAEQKANKDVIVGWFAVIAVVLAVCCGAIGRTHDAINHSSSKEAVEQVGGTR